MTSEAAVEIYHAEPTHRGDRFAPVVIRIAEVIPPIEGHDPGVFERAQALYADQGRQVAQALYDSLPGGTMDALLAELLERRASLFRVSFGRGCAVREERA